MNSLLVGRVDRLALTSFLAVSTPTFFFCIRGCKLFRMQKIRFLRNLDRKYRGLYVRCKPHGFFLELLQQICALFFLKKVAWSTHFPRFLHSRMQTGRPQVDHFDSTDTKKITPPHQSKITWPSLTKINLKKRHRARYVQNKFVTVKPKLC